MQDQSEIEVKSKKSGPEFAFNFTAQIAFKFLKRQNRYAEMGIPVWRYLKIMVDLQLAIAGKRKKKSKL